MHSRDKKIYCFDLDGTLCTQVNPDSYGHGATPSDILELADPYIKRIQSVNSLYDNGHTIIIDTARGKGLDNVDEWYGVTVRQLKEWGVKYHTLRVGVKFIANYYIDDRGRQDTEWFTRI